MHIVEVVVECVEEMSGFWRPGWLILPCNEVDLRIPASVALV